MLEILHPVMAYRFNVFYFRNTLSEIQSNSLSASTTSCTVDLKEHKLHITIQQPVDIVVFSAMSKFLAHPEAIEVHLLHGDATCAFRTRYSQLKLEDHKFVLDYADGRPAIHRLTLSYKSFETLLAE
jgi:hypothetical protein